MKEKQQYIIMGGMSHTKQAVFHEILTAGTQKALINKASPAWPPLSRGHGKQRKVIALNLAAEVDIAFLADGAPLHYSSEWKMLWRTANTWERIFERHVVTFKVVKQMVTMMRLCGVTNWVNVCYVSWSLPGNIYQSDCLPKLFIVFGILTPRLPHNRKGNV